MRLGVVACLVAAAVATARADDADTTIDAETGALLPTRVTFSLVRTVARIEARFVASFDGPAADLANRYVSPLPRDAVVTSGTVTRGRRVERLELARASHVDALFAALLERPGRGSKRRWGVRIDGTSDMTLAIAAPVSGTLAVDVVIEAPTCFVDDMRVVDIPRAWLARVPARLLPARDASELDAACGVSGGTWVALPSRELMRARTDASRMGISTGRLSLPDRDIARVELALAHRLGEVPRDLHTVILVDHSRSLTDAERENQRAIVAAYLRAAPNSRVQIVAYARTTEPLLAGWTTAATAASRIDRALRNLAPRNGSNVDAALGVAGTWLSSARGTRRVLVLSDERLAHRVLDDPLAMRTVLPSGALLHAVRVSGGSELERDDDLVLAPLALATGGIGVTGGVDAHGDVDATSLVRPTKLDHVKLEGEGWDTSLTDARPCPPGELSAPLDEGRSCVWWVDGKAGSGALTIRGWLWGREITRVIDPDRGRAVEVARILSTFASLPSELVPHVELAAHAVNGTWSLFAMWGDSGGYDASETWGTIGVSIGSPCCGVRHHIRGIGTSSAVSSEELSRQLAGAVARCRPRSVARVTIELTREEIVDVAVQLQQVEPDVETCIVEGVWDTALSVSQPASHVTRTLTFQPS